MRIELSTGALQLKRGQTLKVVDGAGSTICAASLAGIFSVRLR